MLEQTAYAVMHTIAVRTILTPTSACIAANKSAFQKSSVDLTVFQQS